MQARSGGYQQVPGLSTAFSLHCVLSPFLPKGLHIVWFVRWYDYLKEPVRKVMVCEVNQFLWFE